MTPDFEMTRREFVRRTWVFGLAGAGAMSLLACFRDQAEELGSQPKRAIQAAQEAADPCNDLSGLTPDERATRTTFNYQVRAKDPTRLCATCNFWVPDPRGVLCGTCTLMKGPIHPQAGCKSWAERRRA